MKHSALLLLSAALTVGACGPTMAPPDSSVPDAATDVADASGPREECNPIGYDEACSLPFPSAFFLRDDATSATRYRVALDPRAIPASRGTITGTGRAPIDPAPWNRLDGFSPNAPGIAYFRERLDPASLIAPSQLARSVTADAPTAIIDMETGERVVHFSEVDVTVESALQRQTVLLRPMVRLKPNHRYAFAITRGVRAMSGSVSVPPGFQALLDNAPERDARLARVAPRYTEIFAALQRAGIERTNLLLAWDIVTASETYLTGPVVSMRDTALAAAGPMGIGITVTRMDDNFNERIQRRIVGTVSVPTFLGADKTIQRDASGNARVVEMRQVPFVAMIPRVDAARYPLPVLQFGHGLFGNSLNDFGQATSNTYMQRMLQQLGMVGIATNWTGLSGDDLSAALEALSNLNALPPLTDALQQSLINALVLNRTIARIATDSNFQVAGAAAVDPSKRYFLGISLGGIMGTSFMGYSTEVDRGVVNVNGGNWSLLFQRSTSFGAFALPLMDYPNRDDRQILFVLAQMLFDPSDPINVAPHILRDRLPGVPEKHLLSQMSFGDPTVTNLSTHMIARSMGLPLLQPAVQPIYGLTETAGPLDSAMSTWNTHSLPLPLETNAVPAANDAHDHCQDIPALRMQIAAFLRPDGRVTQTCTGACDPD